MKFYGWLLLLVVSLNVIQTIYYYSSDTSTCDEIAKGKHLFKFHNDVPIAEVNDIVSSSVLDVSTRNQKRKNCKVMKIAGMDSKSKEITMGYVYCEGRKNYWAKDIKDFGWINSCETPTKSNKLYEIKGN
jgi:hypothetical protein